MPGDAWGGRLGAWGGRLGYMGCSLGYMGLQAGLQSRSAPSSSAACEKVTDPSRIWHRSDEQHTLTGTQASAAAVAAEDASAGSCMHAVAIERVARMLAHQACVAATRALWPLRPRVAREKTVSAGAGSAITWAVCKSVHAVPM